MNSGKEKWPLAALAVAILLGIAGVGAVFGGLGFHSLINETQATPMVATSEPTTQQPTEATPQPVASNLIEKSQQAATTAIQATEQVVTTAVTATQQAAASTETIQQIATPTANTTKEVVTTTTTTTTNATSQTSTSPNKSIADLLTPEQEKEADAVIASLESTDVKALDYERSRWHSIHFKPAINKATDGMCLKCHQEVLDTKTRDASPAGVKKADSLAWYQTLDTYEGEQLTFHQRHMTAPFIKKVANMSCTTCHQGNNLREEISGASADAPSNLTMRKMVDPNVCLMCHGQFPYQNMGLPGPWHESGATFQNNCLLCHAGIRTNRHNVNFLNASAIEKEGAASSDSCYGCHGGRPWYRISFPYPRHAWPGSGPAPDWAKDRPTESDLRFLIQNPNAKQ